LNPLAIAGEWAGVKMPDHIIIGKRHLILNGMGVRTVSFLKLKVYVAGLYLESKSQDSEKILTSKQVKHLNLYFTRDVDAEKLKSVWNESFMKNCKSKCEELSPILSMLNKQMKDMKKGEMISFTFFPDYLEISSTGREPKKIENQDFAQIILSIWLGSEPPNEGLKDGLLGKLEK
jgi:hypothetical protein